MKSKLFNILKPLVADKGLSKEEIEGLAEAGAKNLTETSTDEDIQNVANGLIIYAGLMQRAGNRLATSTENKYKDFVDPKKLEKYNEWLASQKEPPTPPPPPAPTLTQEQITKMIQDGIAEGLKPYKEKEEQTRLASLLSNHEKVKNIPERFRSHYSLTKEEDLETVAAKIEADYTEFKQELVRSGQFQEAPHKSEGETIDEDIQALKDMVAAETKQD